MLLDLYVEKVIRYVEQYKVDADALAKIFTTEKEKIEKESEEMRGKYTQEYITEYAQEKIKSKKEYCRKLLDDKRKESLSSIKSYLDAIEKHVNTYFASPASEIFISAINLIFLSGMKIDATEETLLAKNAKTYFEKKALNEIILSKGTGKKIELPDIEKVFETMAQFSNEALDFVANYTGENMVLSDKTLGEKSTWIASTKCHFFENNVGNILMQEVNKSKGIFACSEKSALSAADKEMIDAIIDPKYPTLAKEQVNKIVQASPEIGAKLMLDERYSQYAIEAMSAE